MFIQAHQERVRKIKQMMCYIGQISFGTPDPKSIHTYYVKIRQSDQEL